MKNKSKGLYIIGAIVVLVVAAVIVLPMIGGSRDESATQNADVSADAVATNAVTISNYSFMPATIKVKQGTTVTWTNQDTVEHTVTSKAGASESFTSEYFGKGKTYTYTFKKSGTYEYYCKPHPYMKGTVVVE